MRRANLIAASSLLALTIVALVAANSRGTSASAAARRGRPQSAPAANDFRVAISVSPFVEELFKNPIVYTDGTIAAKNPEELQKLFVAHGATEVYARIATTQHYSVGSGDHSMDRGLERARMAAALNLPFNPELGLFNIYGDVRCQPAPDFTDYPEIHLPGAWNTLTLAQMVPALRAYGAAAAKQILETGAKVRLWDVGNETEFGFAGVAIQPMPGACNDTAGGTNWYKPPDAIDAAIGKMTAQKLLRMSTDERLAWLRTHLWPHEAKMFTAVADGIRSVHPQARFSTHVSVESSMIPAQTVAFFAAMREGGFDAAECGASFYPTSSNSPSDRMQAIKDTATAVQRELQRPLFIAEYGYPAAEMTIVFKWNEAAKGYPISPVGQHDFLRDLTAWGAQTRAISGIRPWAPDLAAPGWGPMSFFTHTQGQGRILSARPALDAIAEGLR